jgi:DNA polymerase-3 subunit alpha
VVAIEPLGYESTYDVEMCADGPLNFLANGIVSHNSHAACYGLIAYRTAWLKANYPAEYMAALISSVMDTKDKVPFFANQAEAMGIEILPPDVNLSDHEFVVVDGNIRFGLDAVKGVGYQAVEAIKAAREEGGPFESLWDFCSRVDCRAVNKKAIEALIKCGAFGSTGASRKGMLSVLEQAQSAGQQTQNDLAIGQGSIFDLAMDAPANGNGAAAAFAAPSHPPIPADEFDQHDMLACEKESIGLFISAHPLKEVREALQAAVDVSLADVGSRKDGEWVTVGGIITQAKKIRTKSGDPMMFATLDDLAGSVEILAFAKVIAEYEGALGVDQVVLVRGRVDHKDASKTCLVVQSVEQFRPTQEQVESAREAAAAQAGPPQPFAVSLVAGSFEPTVIDELKHVFGNFPGETEVVLAIATEGGSRTLRLGPEYRISPTPSLRGELAKILGPSALGTQAD